MAYVIVSYGPVDHARTQGAAHRLGCVVAARDPHGVLQDEGCRRDAYVQSMLWLHRTMHDPHLPSKATSFSLLFVRDARTQIDAVTPEVDGRDIKGGLHSFVADGGGIP